MRSIASPPAVIDPPQDSAMRAIACPGFDRLGSVVGW